MRVVDVRPGRNFGVIGELGIPGSSESVVMQGDKLFIADGMGGVKILDPKDPYRPALISETKTKGTPLQVLPLGSTLYVADYRGLTVLDAGDLKEPELVGEIETPGEARSVCVYKKFAFIADGSNGIQAVHIEYPDSPVLSTTRSEERRVGKECRSRWSP